MSSPGSDDCEHWPSDNRLWTEPAVAVPGYDSNNGLQYHTYEPAKAPSPEKAPPAPVPQVIYQGAPPGPLYWPHQAPGNPQPQYYSHPPQAYYYPNPGQQGYYTYAAPPAPAPMPQPAPSAGQKFHVYVPADFKDKEVTGNVWEGRTKQQVEEDNMKIAKREGAYDKRKIAPVDVTDDQYFWVADPDGGPSTLRDYRYIKTIKGSWKKDPRFEDSYYFLREEEEKKK